MEVIAWGRSLTLERTAELGVSRAGSIAELARRCDILSVHVALTPETHSLINAAVLANLKPGACFINTSRAEVVDHTALKRAIREKNLRVGLDVFEKEPV